MGANTDAQLLLQKATTEGHRILAFWRNHVLLPDGAFHGEITGDGTVHHDAPRSLILATRILWTFARAINSGFADTPEHRSIVDRSYDYLVKHFWDPVHLGFYWMVDHKNHPVQDFKHVYGQSFAIYALSEYYAVSGRDETLKLAQLTYMLVEHKAADPLHRGYLESFHRDWTLDEARDQAPVNRDGPKSMNTHLHLLEAYTRLYQVWPSPDLRSRFDELLEVMVSNIVNAENYHFNLFFDEAWHPIGDLNSYGHDIEGSWLILEAAEVLGDERMIARCRTLAARMVDAVLDEGVAPNYGVTNEGRKHEIEDSEVHWWPQAEGVVGCVNAYQVTHDDKYLQAALGMWKFVEQYLLDLDGGDWFTKVTREGERVGPMSRVNPWKGPYHNARACMEIFHRLGAHDSQ